MEMILSGDRFDSAFAYRTGLVNRIVAQDQLLPESIAYAQQLASRAPIAQQFAKEVIYRAHGLAMDEALRLESQSFRNLADTEDLAEGNLSFHEKREAQFKGK
jgi:enoyl-CoA hydratase/carnithine racemase